MASVATKLTLAEFEEQYGHEKPYYEYWYGEPVQKSMPTLIHGLLQIILAQLLSEIGYRAASEVKLKIDPEFQPLPDLIATRGKIELPSLIEPWEIVVEILSENDPMSRVLTKCRTYEAWGFAEIYVVDPSARIVLRWTDRRLEEVNAFASVPVDRIWSALA